MLRKTDLAMVVLLATLSSTALQAQSATSAPMPATADPSFEVATIKPHPMTGGNPRAGYDIVDLQGQHYFAHNVSLEDLIKFSYRLQERQVIQLPKWAAETRYDISAVMHPEGSPNGDQLRTMLRKLLADRFKLATHTEQRVLPVLALTVGKDGAKMPASEGKTTESEHPVPGGMQFIFLGMTTKIYANFLQQALVDRPVLDRTGLPATACYDFDLTFLPDETMFGGRYRASAEDLANPAASLFTALEEQLGLKLSPEKIPADVLIIDHVEPPSEN